MRAVVYDRYGPPEVLHIEEVAKPEPSEDELRIRIRAAAVTRADCATREANRRSGGFVSLISRLVSGVRRPRQQILGSEFAGEVEALGAAVDDFAVGDRVFGSTGFRFGAHAEFVCVRRDSRVAPMPAGLTFEQAAAITDGGLNSLWCLRLAQPLEERKVLVYGASGAIGSAAVQLAKHFGAQVTAVCGTKNVELLRTLGAGAVIDYTKEDFTRNGRTYDVIMDAVGKHSFRRCKGSLNPGGRYLATDGLDNLLLSIWTARFGDKRVIFKLPPRYTRQDVILLKELVESGRFHPVVDRSYPLEEVVEAARYVETEQKTGNVVLTSAVH